MDNEQLQFHLEVFEGPMDLLLHLIDKNKIDILDIPIALLLEQYMEYVEEYKKHDLDNLSEFLVVSSQLLYIKSKLLLPKEESDEQEDPREELVKMILEYKKYKTVAQTLKEYKTENGDKLYIKGSEEIDFGKPKLKTQSVYSLVNAYESVFKKNMRRMPPPIESFSGIIGTKIVSVTSRVTNILRRLIKHKRLSFKELMYSQKSRSEVVAAFLAVLELSKVKRIILEDSGDGSDTTLVLSRKKEENDR